MEINKIYCGDSLEYGYQMSHSSPETYTIKSLIVECDSQEFHERTEKERRYEKARDRHLLSMGYKVFHYTGSEICKDPIGVAIEILVYLTEDDKEYFVINSNYDKPA